MLERMSSIYKILQETFLGIRVVKGLGAGEPLTADSADELSAPGTDGLRSTPGPRLPGPCLPGPRLPGPRLPGRG